MTTRKIVTIGSQRDLRDMLLSAGVGQYNAILSIPYMNFLPSTTDPYAQGVIQLVQALQRLLNKRGANIDVDGGLGQETVAALIPFSGPLWYDRSWAQLMGDVMTGKPWPGWIRNGRVDDPTSLGDDGIDLTNSALTWGGDVPASAVPGLNSIRSAAEASGGGGGGGVFDPYGMLTKNFPGLKSGGVMEFLTSAPGLALLAVGGFIAYDQLSSKRSRKNPARRRRRRN